MSLSYSLLKTRGNNMHKDVDVLTKTEWKCLLFKLTKEMLIILHDSLYVITLDDICIGFFVFSFNAFYIFELLGQYRSKGFGTSLIKKFIKVENKSANTILIVEVDEEGLEYCFWKKLFNQKQIILKSQDKKCFFMLNKLLKI